MTQIQTISLAIVAEKHGVDFSSSML